jgi:arabinofuranosyltransferase
MGRSSLFGPEPVFDGEAGARDRRLVRTWGVSALILLGLLVFFASLLVFRIDGKLVFAVSDDIYISACYARNLAAGNGAVWYPGAQPVEGFSNPLWTALLALVHGNPLFRESDLGLYLLGVQVLLLVACLAAALAVLRRLLALAGGIQPHAGVRLAAVVLVTLAWASLVFWMAQGFEVGLVLLLGLLAFGLALAPRPGLGNAAWIGALTGICLWTRMDGPLVCAGAFLLLLGGGGGIRRAGVAALVLLLFAAALFAARRVVFGEWLPNTYWLKLSGWPLGERLRAGLERNLAILPALSSAWIALLLPGVRRSLAGAARPAAALAATATLGVAYSIHNGGDSWTLRLGFDRFSAPGAAMLAIALALVVLRAGSTAAPRAAGAAAAVAIALSPALLDPSLGYLVRLARGRFKMTERTFVGYGMALERCSRPGARILTGAAGAIVYFSHRDGSDFLGKCDPWVARQPVNRPDLTSGHNKRYAPEVFRRDRPEFSREVPPPDLAGEYVERSMNGHRVWVRRDGEHVLWDRLQP